MRTTASRLVAASSAVSVLFNEPKLLKSSRVFAQYRGYWSFSALQRAEIAEIGSPPSRATSSGSVSVLFNEPKLLKCRVRHDVYRSAPGFSALQRAEIAEIAQTKKR